MGLEIRVEDPPNEKLFLIRGGLGTYENLSATTQICLQEKGILAFSCYLVSEEFINEVILGEKEIKYFRHRNFSYASVQSVMESGWELLPTYDYPHFSIVLPHEFDATLWMKYQMVFSGPMLQGGTR